MSDTIAARDFILDFLREELIGPSPRPLDVQENGEEILRPQDPPRQRYGAGVLFPVRAYVSTHEQTGEDEANIGEADSPEPAGVLDNSASSHSESTFVDTTPETEQELNLANQYLPSAMGISALVEVPDVLRVDINAATYAQGFAKHSENQRQDHKSWLRQPIRYSIEFTASELLGRGNVRMEKPVVERDGKSALTLHVVSRPHHQSEDKRLMTFTLINRLISDQFTPGSTDCFFQCAFAVSGSEGESCFLPYPEPPVYKGDHEELSLQLLHLHKQTGSGDDQ